jgi:Tfp pilus assembly PilM family ATPase
MARRPRRVRVAVSDLSIRIRILGVEAMPAGREEALRYILWRLGPELGFPPEEARVDYLPLPPGPGETGMRLLCAAASAKVIGQYEALLAQAGLAVSGIAPSSVLLFNLFEGYFLPPALRLERPLLLNIGHRCSTLVMAWNGAPVFWRSLPSGGAEFIQAGNEPADPELEQRERRLGAKRVLQDLLDSIAFCAEEVGVERPDRLILAGGLAGNPRVIDLLKQKVGIPVEVLNPEAVFKGGGSEGNGRWVGWSAALAAALQS